MTIFSNFYDYLRPFDSSSHHGVTLNRNWISRPYIPLMITEIWAQLRPFPSLSGPKNGKKTRFRVIFGPVFCNWGSPTGLSKSLQWYMRKMVTCLHNFRPIKDNWNDTGSFSGPIFPKNDKFFQIWQLFETL